MSLNSAIACIQLPVVIGTATSVMALGTASAPLQ
jgi:hypothetical protein